MDSVSLRQFATLRSQFFDVFMTQLRCSGTKFCLLSENCGMWSNISFSCRQLRKKDLHNFINVFDVAYNHLPYCWAWDNGNKLVSYFSPTYYILLWKWWLEPSRLGLYVWRKIIWAKPATSRLFHKLHIKKSTSQLDHFLKLYFKI